jgi:hypothetical protein
LVISRVTSAKNVTGTVKNNSASDCLITSIVASVVIDTVAVADIVVDVGDIAGISACNIASGIVNACNVTNSVVNIYNITGSIINTCNITGIFANIVVSACYINGEMFGTCYAIVVLIVIIIVVFFVVGIFGENSTLSKAVFICIVNSVSRLRGKKRLERSSLFYCQNQL